jgi:hypothetical protein
MNKHRNIFRRLYPISFALVGICVVMIGANAWSSHSPLRQSTNPRILNKTRAFEVVSQKRNGQHFLLNLKNGYSKNIIGYTVTQGADTPTSAEVSIEEDFIYGDKVIAPGETYAVRIPISEQQSSIGKVSTQEQDINVLAVMFDDGTSDGDSKSITKTKDRRRGELIQLERILPLFQAILDLPDADIPEALDRLESQIAALPEISENGLSPSARSGLKGGKEMLLPAAQMLRRNRKIMSTDYLRKELTEIKSHYERAIAKLRDL